MKPGHRLPTKKTHDWPALKKEFLASEYDTVSDYLKFKGMRPVSWLNQTTGWRAEKDEIKKKALERSKQHLINGEAHDLNEVRDRQARLARFMQLKGTASLKTLNPKDVEEARKLIVSGMETERKALGMDAARPTSLTQINIGPKTNLDKLLEGMDYEGILKLIAELREHRAGIIGEATVVNGSSKVEEGETV
ncbi:MAG: hypothetical protein KCHDKBKB_00767 [Elusimicrobia bacterium]|nr:hypothetical protein [Elusimicrobiota bacterium]